MRFTQLVSEQFFCCILIKLNGCGVGDHSTMRLIEANFGPTAGSETSARRSGLSPATSS
jgi:hypothetical protein